MMPQIREEMWKKLRQLEEMTEEEQREYWKQALDFVCNQNLLNNEDIEKLKTDEDWEEFFFKILEFYIFFESAQKVSLATSENSPQQSENN